MSYWYCDLLDGRLFKEVIKPIFGNKKNFHIWQEARRDNEIHNWLVSMGCTEGLQMRVEL